MACLVRPRLAFEPTGSQGEGPAGLVPGPAGCVVRSTVERVDVVLVPTCVQRPLGVFQGDELVLRYHSRRGLL